jgi:hypothetical protein
VERRALTLYRKAGASRPQVDLARDPQHGQC